MPRSLETYLSTHASPEVALTLRAIALASAELAARIAAGGALGASAGVNSDGDDQKALDVIADDIFAAALAQAPVRWLASEERETVTELTPGAPLAVGIDPLDGSSNIDINVSIGSIFSIRAAREDGLDTFLRPGREQLAAGYVMYGPQTTLVLSLGQGVDTFLLDPATRGFTLSGEQITIAPDSAEFAINCSNYRHWNTPVRNFVDDCLAGADGPFGTNYNMRWIAAMVVEAHRILTRGGVYLYPADARPAYAHGRLRMVYECAPMAMLMEQAGGAATDGATPILDLIPETLHGRVPLIFGSADLVARIASYENGPIREVSPLFGRRGLFSARTAS